MEASKKDDYRGTGRTTAQMKGAQIGSVFLWCNEHTEYAIDLAKRCGRHDLIIKTPSWLESMSWVGMRQAGIVVDHACNLNDRHNYALTVLFLMVR